MEHRFRHLLLIQTLVSLAGSSAGTFGIVYLAKDGIAPGQGLSFAEAPLFYLFGFLFAAMFCLVMAWRPSFRVKSSMTAGLLALGLTYLGWATMHGLILVTLLPFFYGVSIPLFYLPFNALIIKRTTLENRGMRMGVLFLVVTIASIVGPTFAGAVIQAAGYPTLFAFGTALLVTDAVVIMLLIDRQQELTFRIDYASLGRRNVAALFFEGCFEGLSFTLISLITLLFITGEQQLG